MKEFRKINDKFVCEECGITSSTKSGLGNHIKNTHKMAIIEYFDKWIKEEGEGICVICGGQTKMIRNDRGYKPTCSIECQNKHAYNQTKIAILKKYGVENLYQSEIIKEKCKNVMIERYGYKSAIQNPRIKEQIKQTNLRKYGCETPMGNPDSFNKQQHITKIIKKYKDTDLWYQASYELDFLDQYYEKHKDIKRGPYVKYKFNEKNKTYYSDFYIPSLNLVVEIKNSWLYKRDKEIIEAKEKATIENGFNYCIIIDKDYSTFNEVSARLHLLSNLVTL